VPTQSPLRRVVGAWLVRDGLILVLQRSGGMSDGLWVPPGGNVDPGEEPLAAVIRETLEETGLTLSQPRFLRSWVWNSQRPAEVHHFVGMAEGPIVRLSDEHYDFEWLTPADYICRHLPEGQAGSASQWMVEMRRSAELVVSWLSRDHRK
jgi:8-oxo-dGTP pyrophosphatase MutT (NUDIX family)